MFNLNFKENLKEIITDEMSNAVDNQIDKVFEEEPVVITGSVAYNRPLATDKYEELVELIKDESKKHIIIQKQRGENLFSAKSVITTFAFLLTSVLVQVDVALADGIFSNRESIQVAITLIGAISTVAARGSEGSDGVYTPHGIWGKDKEDYDLNDNGIDDRLE